jgi:small subunit ribosomal protein S16
MVVIRLARQGRNKYPVYRIVAAESARAATGKFLAVLGHYNPHTKELTIQHEETLRYIGNGAQPSNSVIKLLQRDKVELPAWAKLETKNKAPKKEPVVKEEAPVAEAEAAETAEVPTETEIANPETVAEVAAEQAEAIEESVPEAAVEDTAAGEEAEAEKAEATEEASAEAAAE